MAVKRKNHPGSKKQKQAPGDDSLLDMLHPNNILNNAQKVINSAVNVLEEEIAAGIIAAKRIERKVIDVDEVRHDSQNLMNRIRRDTHEALDIFLDALAALSKQVGVLSDAATTKTASDTNSSPKPEKNASPVQVIEHGESVKAGESIHFSFLLSDDELTEVVKLSFQKSDFFGPTGQKVPARGMQVMPSPLMLAPGEEKEVTVRVNVPLTVSPGQYNSILTISQMPAVKIILTFRIS